MKKLITNLKVLMTLLLLCGVSSAFATNEDITVTISSSDIPDGYAASGANGTFTATVDTNDDLTIEYSGINTKSSATAEDHAYRYAMFVKNYGVIFSKNCPTGYYPSKVTATFTSTTGVSGKVGVTFGTSIMAERDQTVTGSVAKSGTCVGENTNESNTYWNFSTTGANVQVSKIEVVYSKKSVPTTAYTVTFNAGSNGTCATPSLTEVSAGSGIELPACTPNAGYAFIGWATESEAINADAGVAGSTYSPSKNCTLYAVYKLLYTITIETPDNGTLIVKSGETPIVDGSTFADGTTFTIDATPDEGYKFRNWQAVDASTHTYSASNHGTYTINGHDVTFKANFDLIPIYTINYMVNGVNVNPQENVYEGTALTFPEVPNTGSKVFVGWAEATIEGTINTKPLLISTTGLTAKTNNTYYAVFANLIKGSSTTVTDVINHDFAGVENQDDGTGNLTKVVYTDWSNKAGTSGAVYAGQTAGNYNSVQMRSDKNNSGIITTTSGGRVKSITVEWKSETVDGRTLNIYGKGSAYTSPTELYSSTNRGDLIGTIVKGTSTTLNITDDYTYIALRSNNGAMYLTSISIAWEQGTPDTYSDYCTTLPDYNTVVVGASGYATYSSETYTVIPDPESGVQLFGARINDEGTAVTLIPTAEGQAIGLKGEGFIVKATPNTTVFIEKTGENGGSIEGNQLVGTVLGEYDLTQGEAYLLSATSDGTPFFGLCNEGTLAPFKAFLPVPAPGVKAILAIEEGGTTGISTIKNAELNIQDAIYNLAGQKVGADYKGIVIRNGKKMLNK